MNPTRRLILTLVTVLALITPHYRLQAADRVQALIDRMTLEEKIGQLFVVRFWGNSGNDSARKLFAAIRPGSYVLLKENINSPAQITALTNDVQTIAAQSGAGIPVLIMTDQEGGRIQRLRDGFSDLPAPIVMGAVTQSETIQAYGAMVGHELASVGVNMSLAPVVDLATTPDNYVLLRRTMSDDPVRVGRVARDFTIGMARSGVLTVAKHFPGHGDVLDTHVGKATLPYDLARLSKMELPPFVTSEAPAVMVGHITVPALDDSGLPATLSPKILGHLRDQMGYDGILISDAMDMGAIRENFDKATAAVESVKAGIDLLLLGAHVNNNDQLQIYRAVLASAERGDIPIAQIDASVRRILEAKLAYGLLDWTPLDTDPNAVASRIAGSNAATALDSLYAEAVTVVKNDNYLLPIQAGSSVGVVYPNYFPQIGSLCTQAAAQAGITIESMPVLFPPPNYQRGQMVALSKRVDRMIIFTEDAYTNPAQVELVKLLPSERTLAVALWSIYDLRRYPEIAAYAVTYAQTDSGYRRACEIAFGLQPAAGVLPMRITDDYTSGHGLIVNDPRRLEK